MDPARATPAEFAAYLDALGADLARPEQGFFGPTSLTWRVSREPGLHLGGPRALLMQLAHPDVAQGVADHSDFTTDPWGRAERTFQPVYTVIFGTREEAVAALARVHNVHRLVRGPSASGGPGYYANQPHLLFWVHATLVDSALYAYETFLGPLSSRERDAYYGESRLVARLYGVPDAIIPPTFVDFQLFMRQMLAGDTLRVGPLALSLKDALLNVNRSARALTPLIATLAANTLPGRLAADYGFALTPARRAAFQAAIRAARVLTALTPATLRAVPQARTAERRLQGRLRKKSNA